MSRLLNMTPELNQYMVDHSVRDHPVLAELRAATAPLKHAGMQIGAEQGQFMQFMVRLINAKKCIEVGVFTGYSSLSVALALPSDGTIIACDISEEWTAIAKKHWEKAGVANKVTLKLAPANETLDKLLADGGAGKYDFAFIDADKPAYLGYYERLLKLMRPNGLIMVIDDNELVRIGMRGLLKSWGCLVVTAESEDTAMAKLADHVGRPDLIISDYHIAQGKAGFELIDRLRRACGAQIPAFLISGDTAPERLREASASGYYLLHKPILPITLRSVVSQLLKNQQGDVAAPEPTIAPESAIRAPAAAANPTPPLQ